MSASTDAFGQFGERFPEIEILGQHQERKGISALAAPEAVKVLGIGKDDERWRLFLMERAEPLKISASLLERDRLTDDIDDIESVSYFIDYITRHGAASALSMPTRSEEYESTRKAR